MANDYFVNILEKAIEEKVNELLKDGISEQEIIDQIQEMNIEGALSKLIDTASHDELEYLKSKIFEISAERKSSALVFIARQEQAWGKCFAVSDTMYILATEMGEAYGRYVEDNISVEKKAEKRYTFMALQHIHGRACQEFLEILYLMKLGFADGAYARWRSMYELCCIGSFIRKYGEQIAKQYYEQSETEEQFYQWTKGAKDDHGNDLNVKTFKRLQEACNIREEWKAQYRLACLVNHGSPQGTFKRLANGAVNNIIPVGHSNYGITTPAEHSAISLSWITNLFLTIFPYPEGMVRCRVLNSWIDVIREAYFSTHDRLFKELETDV